MRLQDGRVGFARPRLMVHGHQPWVIGEGRLSEEAAVSLYLDLEKGQAADIEVVARAALSFAAAIKALAQELSPEADVRVELVSGTEGSLSLNSLIKGTGMLVSRERLKLIAWTIAVYFALETRDYTFGRVMDHLFGERQTEAPELSDGDIQRIVSALERSSATNQLRQVFREAERDPAIQGVGVTTVPGERPVVIVPRDQFSTRGAGPGREVTVTKRTTVERVTVVLVSPVLVAGNRRWKFRGPQGEFGAPVRDEPFIDRVLSGTTPVPMVAGIFMDIELETDEERLDGVWAPQARRVVRVFDVKPPETVEQASLFASLGQQGEDDD